MIIQFLTNDENGISALTIGEFKDDNTIKFFIEYPYSEFDLHEVELTKEDVEQLMEQLRLKLNNLNDGG